jgi:chaperonin GroES
MSQVISIKNVKPLAGYVLVEPASTQKQTISGIYLPDSHEEKPQHGTVLACGGSAMVDGAKVECPVKEKDQVIYKKWGGNDFKVGDTEYQFLKFEDVLAVIK